MTNVGSVTAALKDCLSTGLTNCRTRKESGNETKARGQKAAGENVNTQFP